MTGNLTTLAAENAADALEGADRHALEALFRRRAARLARPLEEAGLRGTGVLSAMVGPSRIAVRLTGLAEVMPLHRWSPVPGWPLALLGVAARRGNPLPVVDMHHLLGHPAPAADAPAYVLLARCPGGIYGLRIESLGEVSHIDAGALVTPGSAPDQEPQHRSFVEGIAPDGLILIDPGRLTGLGGPLEREIRETG